jgi:putative membrane protein
MMNRIESSLSTLSAVAVVLGLAACSHDRQPASAPQSAQATGQPTMAEQYGSAMGQPGAAGTGEGPPVAPSAQPGATPETGAYGQGPMGQGAYGQTGQGQMGQTGQMGQMGQMGSTGQMGQDQMGGTGVESGQPGTGGQPGVGSVGGAGGTAGLAGMDVSLLNDEQLAAVLKAIHQGEIQEAQIAESKARSPDVKAFAQRMMRDHQQAMNKDMQLFSRLQITPSQNPISQQLQSDAQTHLANLQGLSGADFDRSYIDEQVRDHNSVLELLDRAIPNVKNAELKADMQNLRSMIAAHLAEAERIQQTLQRASPSPSQHRNR